MNDVMHMVRLPDPVDPHEIRYLGDVQRLSLGPDDIVVISVDRDLTADDCALIKSQILAAIPDNKVLVLVGGMKIGVMGPE